MGNLFRNMAAKRVEKWMLSVLPPTFKLINNLIYCKTGLNVGGVERVILLFHSFCSLAKQVACFCDPFFRRFKLVQLPIER